MNRTARRSLAAVLLLLVGLLPGAVPIARANPDDPAPAKPRVMVGYVYGPPRGINFKLYTHLCHAFVTADADGSIRPSRLVPSRGLTADAHQAGVRVLLSLGGWGWDSQFAAITADQAAEDRYVQAVLKIVAENDYDGIDLDWEYPDTPAEVAGFERLARRFRTALDEAAAQAARPMALTMAASANPGTLRWLDTKFLVETMDWINVMTYDYAGEWTDYAGHNAPLFASSRQPSGAPLSAEATITFLLKERGLPPDRLALGIPLYGRGFAVGEPYASTRGAPKVRIPSGNYGNLHRLLHDRGWTLQRDDQTKVPWLIAPDRSVVIGFDDAESVALKAEWARRQGLRGVFFWEVAADRLPDGSNPLQEAARQALEK